jgi:GT2 family glycosyltransferase
MNKPPVGVVIVNYNAKESLRETLNSFSRVQYEPFQVLVSDNASTDGSQEMVRTEFPNVQLLAHREEQGYARAASLGMSSFADKTKYIFSTTNDVIVDPEMLNVLVAYAEGHPNAGVMGAKIYYFDHPTVLWHAGGVINPWHGHVTHFGLNKEDHPRYDESRECDFVTGCGFLLRSEVLKKVGFFKQDLIFYSEDADLCYKIREQGYEVVYVPRAKMWHKVSMTLAKNRPLQLQYSTRNALYLLRKHKVGYYPISLLIHLFLVIPCKMFLFAVVMRWQNSLAIFRGVLDWHHEIYGWINKNPKPADFEIKTINTLPE